jgi:hypothetical protein
MLPKIIVTTQQHRLNACITVPVKLILNDFIYLPGPCLATSSPFNLIV